MLLYVHRNRRLIRDGSPGRPPRLSHSSCALKKFMFKVLKAFGFKKDICRWIEMFYTNIKSTVIVNGQPSKWFPICRGCRQGDPISPYLFILCVKILGIMIRENKDIKGIFVNNVEHKLSQYADDTEFLLAGDRE